MIELPDELVENVISLGKDYLTSKTAFQEETKRFIEKLNLSKA